MKSQRRFNTAFESAHDIITATYLKDPTDAGWSEDPGMKKFQELLSVYSSEGGKDVSSVDVFNNRVSDPVDDRIGSDGRIPAIDREFCTGDVTGGVARQKGNH